MILAVSLVKHSVSQGTVRQGHPAYRVVSRVIAMGIAILLGGGIGGGWAIWQAQSRLNQRLDAAHHDTVSRLVVRITELPLHDELSVRFAVELDQENAVMLSARFMVNWAIDAEAAVPVLKPGQRWRMALVLRHPHGLKNSGGYDAEGRYFAMGILATATVRGTPVLLSDDPWFSPGVLIERVRYRIREGMRHALQESRYGPVLIALAMGDQASVKREDWQIFNRSGITHLVSISGMHVTLIAAVGGVFASFLWRRVSYRRVRAAEYLPAQVVGAVAALIVAFLYCLLAGWGVPARRTFCMLAVIAFAAIVRLPLSSSRVLLLAGAAVTVLDPWATLAPGFWLSFGAVAILFRIGASISSTPQRGNRPWRARVSKVLIDFSIVQGAITLGLVPLLAVLMNQVSLVSPLVNAYAIPIVSFFVTPCALACALFSVVPGCTWLAYASGMVGHMLFDVMMVAVAWMSTSSWAVFDIPSVPWIWATLAFLGVAWAVQPPGLPGRWVGWLLMVPMLCWRAPTPLPGYWRMTALDVGQGSAIVVETSTQVLLFDTGPAVHRGVDAGERVVVPYLRSRGYRHIDAIVVSHADADHSGGLLSVISAVTTGLAYSSFDLGHMIRKQTQHNRSPSASVSNPQSLLPCRAGTGWTVDEVQFSFLHPDASVASGEPGNASSCVLLVQGKQHALLLPGDIGVEQERRVARHLPAVDVVLAPHHGSKTSSGDHLIKAVRAEHVIAQVGYMNRFHHPTPSVRDRWVTAGATFWRTDHHGAVVAYSRPEGLDVKAQSDVARRYWHLSP